MKKLSYLLLALMISGVVKAQYPLLTFNDIQFIDAVDLATGANLSYLDGDTVRIQGYVTFDPCDYALSGGPNRVGTFLQDSLGAPWGGVHVLIDPGAIGYTNTLQDLNDDVQFIDNFQVGNKVECTGIISDFAGNTQIVCLPTPSSIIALGSTPPAPVIANVDDFMMSDGAGGQLIQYISGEEWEGVRVEIQNVFVSNVTLSGDRYFWDLNDGAGNLLSIRDMSGFVRNGTNDSHCPDWTGGSGSHTPAAFAPPAEGSLLTYVRGTIVEYTVSGIARFGLAPDQPSDIGAVATSPPVIGAAVRNPSVAGSADAVDVTAEIYDVDGTIASATLNWSIGLGSTSFTAVTMSNTSGDLWTGTVPATGTDSTYVNYWISATDNTGNTSNSPDTLATGSFYLVYDDGINSIIRIQKTHLPNGNSIWAGDSIPSMSVSGIVTSGLQTYDLGLVAIQDGTSEWSGIFLQTVPGDGTDALFRGDEIEVTSGRIIELFGVTYISDVTFNLTSTGNALPAPRTDLNADSIDAEIFTYSEPYEGMYARWNSAFFTSNNADAPGGPFGEWRFNAVDVAETGLRCDDYSADIPNDFAADSLSIGDPLGFIQGILFYSFGNYKLIPRNLADIDGFSTDYPNAIVSFNFNDLVPTVNGVINQTDLTIMLEVPSSTDVTALVPTIDFTGQSVSPATAVAQDFTSPVIYTVTAPISNETLDYTVTVTKLPSGIDEIAGFQNLSLFPNPTDGVTVLALNSMQATDLVLGVYDLVGRQVFSGNYQLSAGEQQLRLDLSELNAGEYVVELRTEQGVTNRKLCIMH